MSETYESALVHRGCSERAANVGTPVATAAYVNVNVNNVLAISE